VVAGEGKISMTLATGVLLAATVCSALACGATFDQMFKQLPARHQIGATAYAAYVRAADLSNGLIWYPIIGISTTLLCVAAVVTGVLNHPNASHIAALSALALGTIVFTVATARAAPTLLTLRTGAVTEATAQATLNRFARFNAVRAVGIAVAVAASAWALAVSIS
jgi:hypothetical protein